MKRMFRNLPALCLVLLAAAPFFACSQQQGATETATGATTANERAEDALVQEMDSVETSIDHSVERLEDKAKELERAMEELDTTAITTKR